MPTIGAPEKQPETQILESSPRRLEMACSRSTAHGRPRLLARESTPRRGQYSRGPEEGTLFVGEGLR
eukprot:6507928-Pyramimonas_sp.AAC.1